MPASVSRLQRARVLPSSNSSREMKVAWAMPSRAASIWPAWLESSSMACFPISTKSGFSFCTSAFSTLATARESRDCPAWMRMARSAPMARPVRSCSTASSPPIETTTMSISPSFSSNRSASSSAIKSKGLTAYLTPSVSMSDPSGLMRIRVSASGTRLRGTRILMGFSLGDCREDYGPGWHNQASSFRMVSGRAPPPRLGCRWERSPFLAKLQTWAFTLRSSANARIHDQPRK